LHSAVHLSSRYSLVWLDIRPCLTATQCYRWSDNAAISLAISYADNMKYGCARHSNVTSRRDHGQIGCHAPAGRAAALLFASGSYGWGVCCCLFWWETLLLLALINTEISRNIDGIRYSGGCRRPHVRFPQRGHTTRQNRLEKRADYREEETCVACPLFSSLLLREFHFRYGMNQTR
jgi:hypothetical protein